MLLVDNDKQANTSSFYKCFNENILGTHSMLTEKDIEIDKLIQSTKYENLDIITTNMNLLVADKVLLSGSSVRSPQRRYKSVLKQVSDKYDYCIIDNAPSLDFSVINALCCSKDIILPVKVDSFCDNGLELLISQLEEIKLEENEELENVYLLFTICEGTNATREGIEKVKDLINNLENKFLNYECFETKIRKATVVVDSINASMPLTLFKRKATTTEDYIDLTAEYLSKHIHDMKVLTEGLGR